MGLFAKIKGAKGTEGGNYFQPGLYVVQVERCVQKKKRDEKTDFFAAELKLLESSNGDADVGTTRSFYVEFKDYPELSLGNVADFMNAAMKSWFVQRNMTCPEGFSVDEGIADDIVGEDNILAGTVLGCEAYNKPTRAGNDFTRFKWTVATPELVEKYGGFVQMTA